MHYKESEVLLQSWPGFMHALERRSSVITKWDKFDVFNIKKVKCYYNVIQV